MTSANRYFADDTLEITCKRCGATGHKQSECTAEYSDFSICFKCARKGHLASACPNVVMSTLRRGVDDGAAAHHYEENLDCALCLVCGKFGHANCAFDPPKKSAFESTCPKCGAEDHDETECQRRGRFTQNFFTPAVVAAERKHDRRHSYGGASATTPAFKKRPQQFSASGGRDLSHTSLPPPKKPRFSAGSDRGAGVRRGNPFSWSGNGGGGGDSGGRFRRR